MRDTIRLYDVFNGDHVERDDEVVTLLDRKGFDDNHGAMDALGDYLCDVRGDTNRLSREAGAEDRDHLLACALTTLAQSLPGFNGMDSDEAREVIVPVIHGWLNKSEVSPPAIPVVGIDREPGLDRSWGRLPVTVASGGGACGDTIRMVYEGLCGLSALIEWSEGDRVVRHPVLIETFVQLDDLSPVLVGEMLYDVNYEPTGTKVFLRFSAIRSVEVS